MPFSQGLKMVKKASTERDKEKWFRIWLIRQPSDGEYVTPFDTWYAKLLSDAKQKAYTTDKSTEEILAKVADIRERMANNANI